VIKTTEILIPKYYYGGIDESNHGRTPEIYSLVLSTDKSTIIEQLEKLPKIRKKQDPNEVYKTFEEFRYLTLEEKILNTFGVNAIKPAVFAHLLQSADINPRRIKVLIDGHLPLILIDETINIYKNLTGKIIYRKRIQAIEHGDQWYPIINSADLLAHTIYKNIQNQEKLPSGDKLVKLPLELRC